RRLSFISRRLVAVALILIPSTMILRAQEEPPPPPDPAETPGPNASPGAPDPVGEPAPANPTGEAVGAGAAAAEGADLDAALRDAERPYWRTNLFRRFFSDQKFMFTTWWPTEFRRWQFTGPLLAGVTLAGVHGDNREEAPDFEVQNYVQAEAGEHGSSLQESFSFIGNAGPAAFLLGVGYLAGRWSHHDQMAEASSLSAEGLLTTGLYVTVLKRLTGRTRPAGGADGSFFTYHAEKGQVIGSFPSGHAAGAFTVATVFAETYKDHPWVGWVFYGAAGMVGWARVAQGRHFVGDVVVGGLIGHSVGRMVTTRGREEKSTAIRIEPFIDPAGDGGGVMVSRRW
ncbi:MAG TPA: phosphatase PAP2 family protein, partial [Dongiaceae bacterium]|nr:phosphatase PAP2 family protein [Dongiaceae bacterium]